jgi:hypothetical protein
MKADPRENLEQPLRPARSQPEARLPESGVGVWRAARCSCVWVLGGCRPRSGLPGLRVGVARNQRVLAARLRPNLKRHCPQTASRFAPAPDWGTSD